MSMILKMNVSTYEGFDTGYNFGLDKDLDLLFECYKEFLFDVRIQSDELANEMDNLEDTSLYIPRDYPQTGEYLMGFESNPDFETYTELEPLDELGSVNMGNRVMFEPVFSNKDFHTAICRYQKKLFACGR